MTEHLMTSGLIQFILAGKAFFTLVSKKTDRRYTFRVVKCKTKDIWFVSFLRGQDNLRDYGYLGIIKDRSFILTGKSTLSITSGPVVAIKWFVDQLRANKSTQQVEFYHAGRCGRCGRLLTVPESITAGYGPECIHLLGHVPLSKSCGYCGEDKPGCRCERKAAEQKAEQIQEQLAFETGP